MKEQNEEKNLEVVNAITQTEEFIKKNQKTIITVAACVVVAVLAVFAYVKFVSNPRQVRAAEDMFAAEQWFNEGNFEQALNGNDQFMGFLGVIDQYGCTKSANLAKYYAGICQLNLGQFDEAIKSLKSYKGKDVFTAAESLMLIGDCYAEKENAAEAASYYEKAAAKAENNFVVAGTALWKAGMVQLQAGNKTAAIKNFQKIKDNYPESPEYAEVDKYIAYAEAE